MYKILILSGAGLSAESGIETFRGNGGRWEKYNVMEVCSTEGFEKDRELVSRFYDDRRIDISDKLPNYAHKKIAEIKAKYPNDIAVVTQNVDDLLERAGCDEVIHLHGTLIDLRCEECGEVFHIGYKSQDNMVCPSCDSGNIRHNVVMFGEPAPLYSTLDSINQEIEMFIVIGSSGQVLPLGMMATFHENSILNNLDVDDYIDSHFKRVIHKGATEAIDEIIESIENFLEESKNG